MKAEKLYNNLIEVAEKLEITVHEKNLRNAGLKVRSGLCKVKGKYMFIMDKHVSIHKKNRILADCLKKWPCDQIFMIPAVRDYLSK